MEDMTLGKMSRDQLEEQLKSVKEQVSALTGTVTLLTNELAKDCLEGASVDSRVEANADTRTPMVTVTCFREPYKGRSVRFNAYRAFEDQSILVQDLCKAMPGVRIIPKELKDRVEEECVKVVMRDISLRVSKKDVPWLDVARDALDRAIARSVQNG
jgi:hypothetical protein